MKAVSAAAIVLMIALGACASNTDLGASSSLPPQTGANGPTGSDEPTTTSASPTTVGHATTTVERPGCSAAGHPAVPVEQDLPATVAQTREAIVEAVVGCDIARLAELAGPDFTYSFGGGDDPAAYWEDLEARSATEGDPSPLTILVKLLELPFATIESGDTTYYVWPSAHAYGSWDDVPPADRDALLGVYGAQDLIDFEAFGGYLGYRVGITAEGDWAYFVAGD